MLKLVSVTSPVSVTSARGIAPTTKRAITAVIDIGEGANAPRILDDESCLWSRTDCPGFPELLILGKVGDRYRVLSQIVSQNEIPTDLSTGTQITTEQCSMSERILPSMNAIIQELVM